MPHSRELEKLIADGYAEGHTRFGDLGLDFNTYENRIKAIAGKNLGPSPSVDILTSFIKTLNRSDLYLATACAKESLGFGQDAHPRRVYSSVAWQKLESEYKKFVSDLARFGFRQTYEAHDVADSLLADLFLPSRSGISRIMFYDGRSSLYTWLRVILSNRVINHWRGGMTYMQPPEMEMNLPDRPALVNLDRVLRARLYGDVVADSMSSACSLLSPRERMLLLWRYEDGLQLGEIAKLLNIHQSNVSRRLQRLHRKLRERIVANLLRQGMSKTAIEECLQDVLDNPHYGASLLDCIAASGNGRYQARAAQVGEDWEQSETDHCDCRAQRINTQHASELYVLPPKRSGAQRVRYEGCVTPGIHLVQDRA